MTIEHIDVVIVGAGISGVSAAWHVQNRGPTKSYAIVEARAAMGGTRDVFRYPGVRSDSDMYTLGFRFRPWTGKKSIADGASILSYLQETAAESGIDGHIRYGHRMVAADWSTATSRWILHVDHAGTEETITCSFLVCSGFYDYAKASRCGIVSSRSGATTFRPPRRLPRRSTGPGCSAGPTWSISRESTGASELLTRVASTRPAPTEPRRLPPGSAPEEYLSRHGVGVPRISRGVAGQLRRCTRVAGAADRDAAGDPAGSRALHVVVHPGRRRGVDPGQPPRGRRTARRPAGGNGRRLDRPWLLAMGARGRAMLLAARGDLDVASAVAERSIVEHDRLPMPFERARTQLLVGQLQRRRRQKDSAATTLNAALRTFEQLGTPLWADRARAELARVNVAATGAALNPSEQRIAELTASGMTNRDVAAAMVISPKTVEANLSRSYQKPNIRSRAELGRRMGQADG